MTVGRTKAIDLNCDLGESYGHYHLGRDAEMIPLVSSVNVACGFHAGDFNVMNKTVQLVKHCGVGLGAHPSYPDLQGFGRRQMEMDEEEVYAAMLYQLGALAGFAQAEGISLQHVKPHGALYNKACTDAHLAHAVVKAVKAFDGNLILLAPPGSQLTVAGVEAGLLVANEVFADRAYESSGQLRSRKYKDALLESPEAVVHRVLRIVVDGNIEAVDGTRFPVSAQSICLHGDGNNAVVLASAIREALAKEGIAVVPLRLLTERSES